ncbi:MAG: U32 family peptidase [Tenuifilaceae bacterium]
MKSLELLCPAKDYETGVAAINYGADAIYIGAQKFGAREDAGNSLADIEKLIKYAHQYFVKIYVTVNTIIFEKELDQVKSLIEDLYKIGVDAIIIQDMAILEMDLPPIPIFASTQTNNASLEKVKFLEEVGFKRVILARELSIEEIKNIRSKTKVDLEFFVHGALCVSYSGQCYFSQAITGRSANRGACAQPCRSSYDLVDSNGKILIKNKHLLSLKDLNLSGQIADLIYAGITSFKVEGRLKDISYVKNITSHYNRILNEIIKNNTHLKRSSSGRCEPSFIPDPDRSFNRGFTTHFINERQVEQSSMDTQKSIGKRLGTVSKVDDDWFSIKGNPELVNGDGLCYINSKGVLTGIRVNRVDSSKIFPFGDMSDIKVGLEIFRNFDQQFTKLLSSDNQKRLVNCKINVMQSDSAITFSVVDEDNISVNKTLEDNFSPANNPEKANEMLQTQLAKSGDTIFKVAEIEVNFKSPRFFPTSVLNQIRRELLDELLQKRIESYQRDSSSLPKNTVHFPDSNLDFKGNVSNSLSHKFYAKHGVEIIDDAFELQQKENVDIMVTRYCIKHEIGICPSKQNGEPTGKLYLKDKINLYPLEFDCKNCLMKVKSPIKNK